jgi:hypothetical protein
MRAQILLQAQDDISEIDGAPDPACFPRADHQEVATCNCGLAEAQAMGSRQRAHAPVFDANIVIMTGRKVSAGDL